MEAHVSEVIGIFRPEVCRRKGKSRSAAALLLLNRTPQLHQRVERLKGFPRLRRAPEIDHCHLLHTRDGAAWSTRLFRVEFMLNVIAGVFLERDRRIAALL